MIGAIIGDVIGSPYEGRRMNFFDYDFPLFNERSTFTDDTILTVATAKAILEDIPYKDAYLELGRKYRHRGYGGSFQAWLYDHDPQPYNSWGNGSAMRVSPVGLYYEDASKVMDEARKSAEVTHNHPDAMDGAEALALAIYYAKTGTDKEDIKYIIEENFNYEFDRDVAFYKNNYKFDLTCKGTVIQALTAFFESNSFEDCIRNSVLMGGDVDTLACIAGSVAEAFYKDISDEIAMEAMKRIPDEFLVIIRDFYKKMKVKM